MVLRVLLASWLLASLSACSVPVGATYNEYEKTVPKLDPKMSRLYVYRISMFLGDGAQPTLFLNGKPIGRLVPGTFIMKDIPPGNHSFTTVAETEARYDFTTKAGEETYIQASPGAGLFVMRFAFDIKPEETAKKLMAEKNQYIGSPDGGSYFGIGNY